MKIQFKEPQKHRAILIDSQSGRDQFLETMLSDRGIMVIARYESIGELCALKAAPECDLVIACCGEVDDALCRDLATLRAFAKRAILLVSETDHPTAIWEATAAGADQVLCIGVSVDRFGCAAHSAMAQFEKTEHYRAGAEKAALELENRKLIERAKGIIMEQRNVSEQEAFREIQNNSMRRNVPMPEMARSIIEAKELLV